MQNAMALMDRPLGDMHFDWRVQIDRPGEHFPEEHPLFCHLAGTCGPAAPVLASKVGRSCIVQDWRLESERGLDASR